MNKRSFINKSTEKCKSGRSNKQSNLSETASCWNSLEFNQVENSAKREFWKRETKNINKFFTEPFVKMPFTICAKDGSDYVKIYSVYFNIFFHFYFIRLIYSFAATSTCKIDAEDWYWKKYFTILLLLFGKVESYPWTGCGFSFSTLCHTIFNDLKYSPPVTQQNCKWHSKTYKLLSDCEHEIHMALSDLKRCFLDLKSCGIDEYFCFLYRRLKKDQNVRVCGAGFV